MSKSVYPLHVQMGASVSIWSEGIAAIAYPAILEITVRQVIGKEHLLARKNNTDNTRMRECWKRDANAF